MSVRTVRQFIKMLGNLETWLQMAMAHAEAQGADPESILDWRLAETQWPLRRQIQGMCDTAKLTVGRLARKETSVHEDSEQSLSQLAARIREVRAFLEGVTEADFVGSADLLLTPAFLRGAGVRGRDYLDEFGVPNLYFHAVTAYAILRHHGVELGKRDFIGSMNVEAPAQ